MKRILLGLGGTPLTRVATDQAMALAIRHQAALTGTTVVDRRRLSQVGIFPAGAGQAAQRVLNRRLTITEEAVERAIASFQYLCWEAGVQSQVLREEGDPFQVMAKQSRFHDLSIFSLRSLFDYGIVEDPHDALYRILIQGVGPVLGVGPDSGAVRRIFFGWDGSDAATRALKHLVLLRPWPEAQLHLIRFHSPQQSSQARKSIHQAVDFCLEHDMQAEFSLSLQSPYRSFLPSAEEWGADLIALGCTGRNPLTRNVVPDLALQTIKTWNRSVFMAT
ncbi:MAG: hypothetical protein DWQ01_02240 [Planctomycetota bacterium]|nr:MAG: hypothetical protein DWQ01_02240 [Planctomycetota bacterium]